MFYGRGWCLSAESLGLWGFRVWGLRFRVCRVCRVVGVWPCKLDPKRETLGGGSKAVLVAEGRLHLDGCAWKIPIENRELQFLRFLVFLLL